MVALTIPAVLGADSRPAFPEPPLPTHPELPPPPLPPQRTPSFPRVRTRQPPVNLRLVGNRALSEEAIRAAIQEQLTTIAEQGLTPAAADDTAFFLAVHYRKLGYSQVDVQWKILSPRLLQLTIREGPLTRLGNVTFRGNKTIPDARLYEILTNTQPDAKGPPPPFSETEIKEGVARIRGYYESEGYLDVNVEAPEVTLSADKRQANVTIDIEEGTAYRFGKLRIESEVLFLPREPLLKELEVFSKRPYTPHAVTNLERKIQFFYRTKGYFNAKVTSRSDFDAVANGEVPVTFYVDTGDPYLFGPVKQSGLRRLRPSFLQNRFKALQGKPYNPTEIDERYRQLIGTGLFSNLKLKQNPLPDGTVELDFEVEEADSHEIGFAIGYGSLEGAILGARYLDRNLFGFGRPISFNAEIAQRLLRGEILYIDPWVFDTNFAARARVYALNQDLFDYSKYEAGIRGELSRKVGNNLEASLFLLTRYVIIYGTGIEPEALGRTDYVANSIGTSVTIDYRDSALNPTRGWVFNSSNDLASGLLGSSIDFFRSTFRLSYYIPIGKSVLALGARAGIIIPIGDDPVLPIDERFFNGGSRSVRSYQERSLGPRDRRGNAIGGETFTNFNIEYLFPITGSLKGAVFFDAGSVGRKIEDGLGVTGYAVGLGLRYDLPIGPIRLDYGFNPAQGKNQPTGALHLSFGFAF